MKKLDHTKLICFCKSREALIEFYDEYCSIKSIDKSAKGAGLKILTPKQMLQRLIIALALVNASNNLENLLNEIRQIAYSLYQSKEIKLLLLLFTLTYYHLILVIRKISI